MTRLLMFLFAALLMGLPTDAQDKKKPPPKIEPRVLLAVPLGATPGKPSKIVLRGSDLDNAKEVKVVDSKGSAKILGKGKAAVPDKNPEKVGDSQVEIELTLDDKLGGESISVVVVTSNGETKPHAILLAPTIAELEPNEGFKSAQLVKLPTIIAGTIGRPKDVDVFRFEGKAGQKVVAEVLASRHGSPLDAVLTLYNANGVQLASNDDFAKDHRDARIEAVLPADGAYFLSLIDAHDAGSNLHVYRLVVK